jgi:signal transduction histidine kinase
MQQHPRPDRGADRVQELKIALMQAGSQQQQVDTLIELAWELRMSRPEQARALGQKAAELSQSGDFFTQPYARGLAGSLINSAFIDTYVGELDTAVASCLRALALLKEEPASQAEINAWYTLSWNSFFLGDYPAAMDHGLRALSLAREFGDKLGEAWALDVVASCHGATREFSLAVPMSQEALTIFKDLHDIQGELRLLNNLAYSLYLMQQYVPALDAGYQCLQLARSTALQMDVFNVCCTIATILIDMGRLDEADAYLKESMSGLDTYGWNVTHVNVLQEWSRICLIKNDMQGAESYLLRALELAVKLDQRAEQAICHKSLAAAYEQQGQYSKALEHYKEFHALNETVTGEQASKRLAVLNITYQVEAAQRETEAYRRQANELQLKEEALRQRTTELEARNQELDAFAHTVAHDLKNPAARVVSATELLLDAKPPLDDEERQRTTLFISRAGHKMSNIIDELLLLASVRKLEVQTVPLDMESIVTEAQQRLADMIEQAQAEIVAEQIDRWPRVLGYAAWVEEIWVNYLSNAVKYGGLPPRMELGAETQPDGMVRFWVRDNGPGLAPVDQVSLFTPFTRLDQARTKGHGLGLSIVRRIVEKLGGQVGVESQSGHGSTFFFTLPAA